MYFQATVLLKRFLQAGNFRNHEVSVSNLGYRSWLVENVITGISILSKEQVAINMNFLRVSRTLLNLGFVLWGSGLLLAFAAAGWKSRITPRNIDIAVIGSGAILMFVSRYFSRLHWKRARQNEKAFLDKLRVTADDLTMADPEDRLEDLCILYEEYERQQILERLIQMPKGQRKLKKVLTQMENEDAWGIREHLL